MGILPKEKDQSPAGRPCKSKKSSTNQVEAIAHSARGEEEYRNEEEKENKKTENKLDRVDGMAKSGLSKSTWCRKPQHCNAANADIISGLNRVQGGPLEDGERKQERKKEGEKESDKVFEHIPVDVSEHIPVDRTTCGVRGIGVPLRSKV